MTQCFRVGNYGPSSTAENYWAGAGSSLLLGGQCRNGLPGLAGVILSTAARSPGPGGATVELINSSVSPDPLPCLLITRRHPLQEEGTVALHDFHHK